MFFKINLKSIFLLIFGSVIISFGIFNVHSVSLVTEGGVLGLNLFVEHWTGISPSVTNFVLGLTCFLIGFKFIGFEFIKKSAVAVLSFSMSYKIFEQFDPIWPQLYNMPLVSAIIGALFVGVGTGICVKEGGAVCGDDALAMSISKIAGIKISTAYLISDIIVLLLSLTYIPLIRIIYSLITVVLSGQIIGLINRINKHQAV